MMIDVRHCEHGELVGFLYGTIDYVCTNEVSTTI